MKEYYIEIQAKGCITRYFTGFMVNGVRLMVSVQKGEALMMTQEEARAMALKLDREFDYLGDRKFTPKTDQSFFDFSV